MTELASLLNEMGWSWVLWVVVAVFVLKSVIDMLAEAFEPLQKALGWYGRRIADRRDRRQTQVETIAELLKKVDDLEGLLERGGGQANADLRQEVEQLARQLKIVRWRAEMTDAYLVEDSDFHRDTALAGTPDLPPHTPFPEFERQWRQTHPRPN